MPHLRAARALHVETLLVFALLALTACTDDRAVPLSQGGIHPAGWADFNDGGEPAFHGKWLADNKFPLSRCKQCHGGDYMGGAVGVSCSQSSCHVAQDGTPLPPDSCTTCHGDGKSPRPTTGAHAKHDRFCDTCHIVPTKDQVEQHASGDESTIVRFGNLATKNAQPSFDLQQKVCTNTYCHGASSPAWTDPKPLDCNGCHKAPPDNHGFWWRLSTSMTCTTCHPDPTTDPRHVNGVIDVIGNATCTTCHGSDNHANPPVDLSGGTDPTTRGVGAHARHLDPTLGDRISPVVPCNSCHLVPQTPTDPEHIGTSQRVHLPEGGTYDKQTMTCTVWCHFDKKPGPVWTDNSGAARACDACHGFPPTITRNNTVHPAVAPNLGVCFTCHVYDKSSHANGVVNLKP